MRPGFVYLFVQNREIIYVGQTQSIKLRTAEHRQDLPLESDVFVFLASDIDGLEAELIEQIKPRFNKIKGHKKEEIGDFLGPFYYAHTGAYRTSYDDSFDGKIIDKFDQALTSYWNCKEKSDIFKHLLNETDSDFGALLFAKDGMRLDPRIAKKSRGWFS